MPEIKGVTLDFYQTLVRHRGGQGRGASLMEYFEAEGIASTPWEHRILYDAFEYYGEAFRPGFTSAESSSFWTDFTERLFRRMRVDADAAAHAAAVRRLLGPSSLALYDDVVIALDQLDRLGLRRGVVSNWQKGLSHFLRELGILERVDFVVVSAEVGYQKPDLEMFEIAAERLALAPANILHVGDHPVQDVAAAREVGFQARHLVRADSTETPVAPSIFSLAELEGILAG